MNTFLQLMTIPDIFLFSFDLKGKDKINLPVSIPTTSNLLRRILYLILIEPNKVWLYLPFKMS